MEIDTTITQALSAVYYIKSSQRIPERGMRARVHRSKESSFIISLSLAAKLLIWKDIEILLSQYFTM